MNIFLGICIGIIAISALGMIIFGSLCIIYESNEINAKGIFPRGVIAEWRDKKIQYAKIWIPCTIVLFLTLATMLSVYHYPFYAI